MDVTIHTLRNGVVRVEDAEASLYASIDIVCDKVGMAFIAVSILTRQVPGWGRIGCRLCCLNGLFRYRVCWPRSGRRRQVDLAVVNRLEGLLAVLYGGVGIWLHPNFAPGHADETVTSSLQFVA